MSDGAEEPHTFGATFRAGLLAPGVLSVSIAILVGFLPFAALAVWVDEDLVASERGWLLATEAEDLQLAATSALFRAERTSGGPPRVYLVGPSSARMSIDAPRLERELTRRRGRDTRVVNLTAGAQSLLSTRAIVERLAETGATGVLAIGVGPGNLAHAPEKIARRIERRAPYAFRADVFDEALRRHGADVPMRTGNYFLDNRVTLLPRVPYLARNLVFGAPDPVPMPTRGRAAPSEREWSNRTRRAAKRFAEYETHRNANLALLDEIIERVAASGGLSVALMRAPQNARFISEQGLEAMYDDIGARVSELADRHGIAVLAPGETARVGPDAFLDGTHLRVPAAIDAVTDALAKHLVERGLVR